MVDDGLNIIQNIDNDKDINDYTYLVLTWKLQAWIIRGMRLLR